MIVYPAIDILGGKAVRLVQGDYSKAQSYYNDPAQAAEAFKEQGATQLHVVDLDGAKGGCPVNTAAINNIIRQTGLWVQVGGGIRDEKAIDNLLHTGARKVILGSAAVRDLGWAGQMIAKYGDSIAVGVDAKNGMAAADGWTRTTVLPALHLCDTLSKLGLATLIYTDIGRDGIMSGLSADLYSHLRRVFRGQLIASGGVGNLDDIGTAKAAGADGIIIGKALYENKFTLREAIAYADKTDNPLP